MSPRVVLLTTGGTIASAADSSGALTATTSGEDLLSRFRASNRTAPEGLLVEEVFRLPSPEIVPERMYELARRVRLHAERPEVSGVVVTHGTDTMEESAYFVDVLTGGRTPVVFTGAQQTEGDEDFDGFVNLTAAIELASSPAARGHGVLIVMGGQVTAARGARKTHTTNLRPYTGSQQAEVADVLTGRTILPEEVHRLRLKPSQVRTPLPRVALIKLVAGLRGETLTAVVRAESAQGLVIEGFGMGAGDRGQFQAVRELLHAGVLVVMTTRCLAGPVQARYGQGGGKDMQEAGAILLGGLPSPQLRIAACLALAATGPDLPAKTILRSIVGDD